MKAPCITTALVNAALKADSKSSFIPHKFRFFIIFCLAFPTLATLFRELYDEAI